MSDDLSALEKSGLAGSRQPAGKSLLKIASDKTSRLDVFKEHFSEWCSSILVKETRQALKSRQFIWTYFVLILCVAVWTVLGLSFDPIGYESGRELLMGYWIILGFPLGLIIPFSAYRSLAREFEDGTIQLISITTMKPYQIVIGKFGSSVLQMMTYLSILAPCVMFTYLLRGISFQQIAIGLAIAIGGSICLTIIGLFLAGAFRSRTLGVGVSVLFVLFLGWIYFLWVVTSWELTESWNFDWSDPTTGIAFFSTISLLGSSAGLLLVAAVSQISFPADNRSTRIRIMMIVQQTFFLATVIMTLPSVISFGASGFLETMMMFAGHYWLLMGFLMSGESSQLSRRVQRTLPRSVFSRSFFSLLMPGSGRAFLFSVANLWSFFVALILMGVFCRWLVDVEVVRQNQANFGVGPNVRPIGINSSFVLGAFVSGVFVTWFLSLNFLGMRWFFKKTKREWPTGAGPLISLIFGALMVATLSIGSALIHFNFTDFGSRSYSPFLMVNWYWMTFEVDNAGTLQFTEWVLFFGIQASAVIFLACFVASRELRTRPIEVPERVAIDLEKPTTRLLPVGESIEEIFGELKQDDNG